MMQITDDRHLFVTDEGPGDGAPVVMLPGLGGTSSMYEPQARSLAERHRVVRVEPAGPGRSPVTDPVSVGGWAADLARVLDLLGVETATFVVHSLSTLVLAELARQRPQLVRALVALGPVRSQPDQAKQVTRARAVTVRDEGMGAVVDGVLSAVVSPRAQAEQPLVGALIRESLLAQPAEGYASSCEALAAAAEPEWGALTMPVRLVGGTEDKLSPPATIDALHELLPHADRTSCEGAGHWLSVERPEQVTRIVAEAAAR